ncbi:aldo/keto reductase [Microbacterium sp.]|uniref:aldo/keto reductase n=1 Tax=Microbacterium sp. TaxID=51671 RepID=UPI003A857656
MVSDTVTLRSGHVMPAIGLGTWPLTDGDAEAAVLVGIACGYRQIDTAARYGNEEAVGRGILHSGVDRAELFVTTKLRGSDHGDVRPALERSLAALGLDYVDLYLIHWPLPRLNLYPRAFELMAQLAGEGLIRSIGVSNFRVEHIEHLISETGLVPAVDQIELDPTIQRRALRDTLRAHGIVPQAWSPLGRGGPLLQNPVIVDAAASAGCTVGQLILRWHRAHGIVPVVKSADPARQRENLAAIHLPPLQPELVAALDALDADDAGEQRIRDSNTHEEF